MSIKEKILEFLSRIFPSILKEEEKLAIPMLEENPTEVLLEQIEEVEKLSKQILDEMESKLLTISGMSYNQCNCNTWFYW